MPAEPQAGRLAGTVLASARDHGDQVIAAAHITRAMISWDKGRISPALESLGDAARSGTEVSADARHAQPLLALAAALVDLRRIDQADGILRAAGHDKLQGIASEAVPPIIRARMHRAAGLLADAPPSRGRPGHRPDAGGPRVCLGRPQRSGHDRAARGDPRPRPGTSRPGPPRCRNWPTSMPARRPPWPKPRSPKRAPAPPPPSAWSATSAPADAPRAPRRGTRRRGLADPGIARRRGRGAGGHGGPRRRGPGR